MASIFELLASDHALCDTLFARACADVRAGRYDAAIPQFAALASAMRRHLLIEEAHVFSAWEASLPAAKGLTAVLRTEHHQIRGVLARLADSLHARDRAAFLKHAGTLGLVLQHHNEKEEKLFYPMVEKLLCAERDGIQAAIARETDAAFEAV